MGELLPVIDLTGWTGGDPATKGAIAAQVGAACAEVGFFQLAGHGVPAPVIDAALDAMDAFFALPLAAKRSTLPSGPEIDRGYAPRGTEALAYSVGVDTPPDLLEAFIVGSTHIDPSDPAVAVELGGVFHPNLWPAALPGFEPVITAYFDAANAVARTLTDVFAVALGLDEGWFRPFLTHSTETMRLNHYERAPGDPPPVPGQQRLGAHSDYGVVTVLHADPVPGLEVHLDGAWQGVVPEPGCFLVNLGDLLAQWTNDRWRSTLHRVVPPPTDAHGAARRRSLAFFLDANHDALVECLPTCRSEDDPPRYPPVRAGEHIAGKLLSGRALTTEPAAGLADVVGDRREAVTS